MRRDARIDRLEEGLSRLAEAQARTEAAIRELAKAQARAEERMDRVEAALERLAEAQARTEERVGRLEERMDRVEAALERLAEAQARTEERVGRLEERMDRVEAALERLAEAQARTEERVGRLEEQMVRLAEAQARTEIAVQSLAQQVGRLSETIGFALEDLAREVTPAYLAKHYGIDAPDLERRFFKVDGEEVEVDFYGEGRRDGERVVVIGEVRSRIYGRDVEAAVRQAAMIAPQIEGTPVTVLFGFVIHPSAREAASRLGAIVISSSGRG